MLTHGRRTSLSLYISELWQTVLVSENYFGWERPLGSLSFLMCMSEWQQNLSLHLTWNHLINHTKHTCKAYQLLGQELMWAGGWTFGCCYTAVWFSDVTAGMESIFSQFTASHGHTSCQVSCPGNKLLSILPRNLCCAVMDSDFILRRIW